MMHLELAIGIIDDGSLREPGRRIAALLLRLADVRKGDHPHDPRPELDITQSDLAHLATVSCATIVAHLDELEQLGLIARSYGRLTLVDPAALRARHGLRGGLNCRECLPSFTHSASRDGASLT